MAKRNSTGRVSRLPDRARRGALSLPRRRQSLFEAHAIIEVCRHALESKIEGLDPTLVNDALRVASGLIDDAAAALAEKDAIHIGADPV